MKTEQKIFDSVKMMRDIRNKLTKRYLNNPDLEMKDLEKIREKYHFHSKDDKQLSVYK